MVDLHHVIFGIIGVLVRWSSAERGRRSGWSVTDGVLWHATVRWDARGGGWSGVCPTHTRAPRGLGVAVGGVATGDDDGFVIFGRRICLFVGNCRRRLVAGRREHDAPAPRLLASAKARQQRLRRVVVDTVLVCAAVPHRLCTRPSVFVNDKLDRRPLCTCTRRRPRGEVGHVLGDGRQTRKPMVV